MRRWCVALSVLATGVALGLSGCFQPVCEAHLGACPANAYRDASEAEWATMAADRQAVPPADGGC